MDRCPRMKRNPVVLLLLLACLLAFTTGSHRHKPAPRSSIQIEVILGGFFNAAHAERAVMQTIAETVRAHPNVQTIIVHYSTSWLAWAHLDESVDDYRLVYNRQCHGLQRYSEDGTTAGPWDGVTDQIVRQVTKTHGQIEDVKRFGGRWGGI